MQQRPFVDIKTARSLRSLCWSWSPPSQSQTLRQDSSAGSFDSTAETRTSCFRNHVTIYSLQESGQSINSFWLKSSIFCFFLFFLFLFCLFLFFYDPFLPAIVKTKWESPRFCHSMVYIEHRLSPKMSSFVSRCMRFPISRWNEWITNPHPIQGNPSSKLLHKFSTGGRCDTSCYLLVNRGS